MPAEAAPAAVPMAPAMPGPPAAPSTLDEARRKLLSVLRARAAAAAPPALGDDPRSAEVPAAAEAAEAPTTPREPVGVPLGRRRPGCHYVPDGHEVVVFDCETTGVGFHDRVVSLGAIALGPDLRPREFLHLVFNPGRPSHPAARRVHGLSDEYLARQPDFGAHAEELRRFFRARVLAAHNLAFDLRMLNGEFERVGLPALRGKVGRYCTMLEIRRRYPQHPASLDYVCGMLGLQRSGAVHGALEDAMLAMNVLRFLHHRDTAVTFALAPPENER